jgi:hypothetical protein
VDGFDREADRQSANISHSGSIVLNPATIERMQVRFEESQASGEMAA